MDPIDHARRVARSKTPAQPALGFRSEGHTWREAETGLDDQLLREGERSERPSIAMKA